jgi:hypothetical protein
MIGPFRLAHQLVKLVFGPDGEPLGLDGNSRPRRSSPHDPFAWRPVRPRRDPGGRSGGATVAEPDEEMLVMAVARPRSRH